MTSMTQLNSHEILINIRRSLCRALVVSKEFSHCDWATKTGIMFKELAMQALIINFNLDGITRSDYEGVCNELAPAFAAVPGLISKHWLADETSNTYGGIYLFQDQTALDGFLASELFAAVRDNPALVNATVKPFSILEGPTRVTRGM